MIIALLTMDAASSLYADATTPGVQFINECYELKLTGDPSAELDPKFLESPRQRIEFRSPINANGVFAFIIMSNPDPTFL